MKMDGSVLEEISSFKMLGLTFSPKLNWGSYIISTAKTAFKKIGALFRSIGFFLQHLPSLQIYHTTWNTVFVSGLVLLAATWENCMSYKNRYAGLLVLHWLPRLNPLGHCRNVVSLSLFYRYYFGRCSSQLAQLFLFLYSCGRSTRYCDGLHDFSVTIPRCYKVVNSFFPRRASLCL